MLLGGGGRLAEQGHIYTDKGRYSQAYSLVGDAPGEPGEASPGTIDGGADAGAAGGAGGGGVDGWLCPGGDIVPRVDVV